MNFFKKIRQIINNIESSKTPFVYFILTSLFVMFLRNFLEIFSDKAPISFELFFHYELFYISLIISLIILFQCIFYTIRKFLVYFRIIIKNVIIRFCIEKNSIIRPYKKASCFNRSRRISPN